MCGKSPPPGPVKISLVGGGGGREAGPLEPPHIQGGGLRKGAPRAISLFPQCKCLKILAPTCFRGVGGGQGCIGMMDNHGRSPPSPGSDTGAVTGTGTGTGIDCDSTPPPPSCRSPPLVVPQGGVGDRHLVNPKFFVAAHCVVVWVTVLWGTAACIPCTHGGTFCLLSLKWNLTAQPCFTLGQM